MPLRSNVPDLHPLVEAMRVRSAGVMTVGLAVRIALATTVSYAVSAQFSGSILVLFAPITTLLVVQASPFATVGASIQRVFAAALGVLIATLYVQVIPVNAITFGIAILVSLLVARLVPVMLSTQLQIPVAVVFVLALGSSNFRQDVWRLLDVVIGGAVGILAVYAWPTRPDPSAAIRAVDAFASAIAEQVRRIGREIGTLDHALPEDRKHEFTTTSRALRGLGTTARDEYATATGAVRLHPRAGRVTDTLDLLGNRLTWLSGIAIQVRALGGAADRLYDRPALEPVLAPSVAHALLDSVAELIEHTDAGDDDAVAAAEGIRNRIALTLDEVAAGRVPVAEALQSVTLLGRLDLLLDSVIRGLHPVDEDDEEGDREGDGAGSGDTESGESDASLRGTDADR